MMQLRPVPNRAKTISDIYFWTAAKEGDVQDIIKMQTESDVTPSKFIKKFAQESMIQNVWGKELDWEKTSKWEQEGNRWKVIICFA